MRKTVVMILAVVFVMALAVPAFAAVNRARANTDAPVGTQAQSTCPNFADADDGGVCDNKGTRQNFVDADKDGVCDNAGAGRGMRGQNFVDADENGVCDNAGQGRGRGMGRGMGACDGSGCQVNQ